MIGRTISHYRILKALGAGGMGEVYLAEDIRLGRSVAIKLLPSDVSSDPERLHRFVQEARAASALNHSNIAGIYELGEEESIPFIAMELVEGNSLHDRIGDKPFRTSEIIDVGIQTADALQEAHSKGIVHRDIKPGNIMITSRGVVKVLDFGLAKVNPQVTEPGGANPANRPLTQTGTILGTVHYISPEQVFGKDVDPRADIFSLGVVLYQMATARYPFPGDNVVQMIDNILHAEPEPPTKYNIQLPRELEQVILKCLRKNPEERYQSASELLEKLRALKMRGETAKISRGNMSELSPARQDMRRMSVAVLLVLLAVISLAVYLLRTHHHPINSIAVLPFANRSQDPNTDYLSDGITESIINSLSQVPGLKVLARGTVFSYKGRNMDPREIGATLRVEAVITGEVSLHEKMLVIRANLVRVSDGVQLWGEQYTLPMSNILQVQSEIAGQIFQQLRFKLRGQQRERITKHYTESVEAYQLYLKGLYFWNKRTDEGFQKAIDSFSQAIQIDPHYAAAYAGLADCYTLLPAWALMPPGEAHPKAKAAARRALELDGSLAEAYTALAHTQHNYDWDWGAAEQDYRRAIELNPNYAIAHHWYASLLSDLGRAQNAIQQKKEALRLDPLSLVVNADLGYILYIARQNEEAVAQLKTTLDLDPNFTLAYEYLGFVYVQKHQYGEAESCLKKALALSPDSAEMKAELAWIYAVEGKTAAAEKILLDLLNTSKERYVVSFDIAMIYAGLDNNDQAFEWLKRAMQERSYQVTSLNVEPRLDILRTDPRFAEIISMLGLPKP